MKFYLILTVETTAEGFTDIHYQKQIYFFKEEACDKAKEIGKNAVVIEMIQTDSWNLAQMNVVL